MTELTTIDLDPTPWEKAEKFANMMASSDFAPPSYRNKPQNILVAMQFGHEIGLKPMQAIQNIAVISGRPCLWGDAALAVARTHPDCKSVYETIEGNFKDGTAEAVCEVTRGEEVIRRTFSQSQAQRAGLLKKPGPWQQYPERMLAMRARGFALRDAFPDALKGCYLKEEMEGSDLNYKNTSVHNEKLGVDAVKARIEKLETVVVDQLPDEAQEMLKLVRDAKNNEDLKAAGEVIALAGIDSPLRNFFAKEYREKLSQLREENETTEE